MNRRTFVNLVAVGVAAAALLTYAAAQLLAGAVFDDRYELYAHLPRGGGLLPDKEVTYNGHGIGQVAALELAGDGVRVRMLIEGDVRIPRDVDVVVQRSSAIGEQALDLRPRDEIDEATAFYEAGDTVEIGELRLPPEVQRLLALANEVFAPIDDEAAGTVVSELARAVEGRKDDVRALLRDAGSLSQDVADAGGDLDRFFSSSRVVNGVLAANRDTIAGLIGDISDATGVLTDMRAELEGVLVDAPPTLAAVGGLVERSQPNLSCVLRDLADINAYVAQPPVLHDAAESLRLNRFFFDGFGVLAQKDPWGGHWQRLRFELRDEQGVGHRYEPQRPTPVILPGGACTSPFGEGAPSATEAGHVPLVTDTRVERPDHDRMEPVRRPAPSPAVQGSAVPVLLGAGLLTGVAQALGSARRSGNDHRRPRPRGPGGRRG